MIFTVKPLGELCVLTMGRTPPRGNSIFWDASRNTKNIWISIADMTKCLDGTLTDSKEYLSDAGSIIFPKVKVGTLLMSFKLSIGKLAIAGVELQTNEAIVSMNELNEDLILRDYLYYFLFGYDWSEALEGRFKVKGNTLNKKILEALRIKFPPIEIQREIVEKLDGAFAEIDALGESITKRIDDTSELFAKICLKRTQDLNPSGFKSLKEIATLITKGTTPTSLGYKFTSTGINFLKVESLDENGGFIGNKFAHIDSTCHESLKRSQLEESDVLVSIAGALGRTAIVTAEICPANVNQALSLIRLPKDSEISPRFLFALFQAGYFRFELDQMCAGAAQQNLSLAQIGSLKVPIFPEPKQIEFIDFLNNLRGLVTDFKNHLENQYLLKSELQKSILTTTFLNSTDNELVS